MSDYLLYLKFLLDPIVYAWRVLKYRDSLGKIYCTHKDIGRESKVTGIERSTTELNQSAITLFSFKTLPMSESGFEPLITLKGKLQTIFRYQGLPNNETWILMLP